MLSKVGHYLDAISIWYSKGLSAVSDGLKYIMMHVMKWASGRDDCNTKNLSDHVHDVNREDQNKYFGVKEHQNHDESLIKMPGRAVYLLSKFNKFMEFFSFEIYYIDSSFKRNCKYLWNTLVDCVIFFVIRAPVRTLYQLFWPVIISIFWVFERLISWVLLIKREAFSTVYAIIQLSRFDLLNTDEGIDEGDSLRDYKRRVFENLFVTFVLVLLVVTTVLSVDYLMFFFATYSGAMAIILIAYNCELYFLSSMLKINYFQNFSFVFVSLVCLVFDIFLTAVCVVNMLPWLGCIAVVGLRLMVRLSYLFDCKSFNGSYESCFEQYFLGVVQVTYMVINLVLSVVSWQMFPVSISSALFLSTPMVISLTVEYLIIQCTVLLEHVSTGSRLLMGFALDVAGVVIYPLYGKDLLHFEQNRPLRESGLFSVQDCGDGSVDVEHDTSVFSQY